MQKNNFKKIAAVLLSLGFVFIFRTAVFAAPNIQCDAPIFANGNVQMTAKSINSQYTDWDTYTMVVALDAPGVPVVYINATNKVVLSSMTRDTARFDFSVQEQNKYNAYVVNKGVKTLVASCGFTVPKNSLVTPLGTPPAGILVNASGSNQLGNNTPNPNNATGSNQLGGNNSSTTNTTVAGDDKVTPGSLELKIKNPLGVKSIEEVIQKIMSVIVKLAIPVIICFFIYSGFLFITAQGSKTELEKAKRMFVQVVIGSVIILGAWTIASAIVATVNLITG